MKIINPIVTFLVASFFSLCLMTCDLGGDVDFEQGSMQKLGTFSRKIVIKNYSCEIMFRKYLKLINN